MLALGIILIAIASVALLVALFGGSPDTVIYDLGPINVETSALAVFLFGAATVLVFVMGLEMIRSGVRRENRRRKERKELNRLSKKLETRESEQTSTTGATTTDTATGTTTADPGTDTRTQ
jgi:uncharacterized membrane protein